MVCEHSLTQRNKCLKTDKLFQFACDTNISEILAFCLIALLLFCLTEKNPINALDTKI